MSSVKPTKSVGQGFNMAYNEGVEADSLDQERQERRIGRKRANDAPRGVSTMRRNSNFLTTPFLRSNNAIEPLKGITRYCCLQPGPKVVLIVTLLNTFV